MLQCRVHVGSLVALHCLLFFFLCHKTRAGVVSTKLYRRVGFSQSGANLASVGVLERENR